jgi:hypothetical protein
MRIGLALILTGLACRAALAAEATSTRVLHTLDFEERRLGNPEELPMHWTKLVGKAYPHYVNGRLATDRARSGRYSFRFDLNGGSLVYRYDPGQIPVRCGAHYKAQVFVQTTPMQHARARLTAYLVDLNGRALFDSIRHSRVYSAARDRQDWAPLSVELSASDPKAAFLAVELELLQPALHAPTSLGANTIFPQDIQGTAWFDDLTVAQVPKVRIRPTRPGSIFRQGEHVSFDVSVNDRFTSDLAAQLVVRDALGRVVHQRSGALDVGQEATSVDGDRHTRLTLPDLAPGWYGATLEMTSGGQSLGQHTVDLVRLADRATGVKPDERFGVIATDLPFDAWADLASILPVLAAGRVKLAVWSEGGDIDQSHAALFDHLLVRLQELQITPTAVLLAPPPNVARRINDSSWLGLLRSRDADWKPQLAYMVSRHATHLDRWQLGADGSDAFVTQKDMRQVYQRIYREFAQLIQQPDLAMPWPAWYELEGELPATVALAVPPAVLPEQIPLYMHDIRKHDRQGLSLSLQPLDRQLYGRELQIRDLAQRVVYALSADAQRIDIPLPFSVRREGEHLLGQPQELLMVVRTLITTLSGATPKGKVAIADDVEAFLFDRAGQGILALWDRGSQGGVKQLALHLGERPMAVDLWGNVTPLLRPREAGSQSGQVQLSLGPMPIFLIDIDAPLAQLRASVRFDRPLIESSFSAHSRRIRFVNPWKQTVSGSLKLTGPPGWTLNPPTLAFSVNPGETFEREIGIEFPYSSFAGPKTVHADFQIQADRACVLRVPLTLTLGLSDVGMRTLALRDGRDIVVQQFITNYGQRPIDYTAFATYPGEARQERLVTQLAPGRSTIKRYRFVNARVGPAAAVRVGLKELDGTRMLNEQVEIQ